MGLLYREAFRKRQDQEESERWWGERKKHEAEQKQSEEAEQARIKELEQQAEAFDRAAKIRAFLKSLEGSNSEKDSTWIEWAYKHADSIDPLKEA